MSSPISTANTVIAQEIEGLSALAASLGAPFLAAFERLQACKGRVIVSGMGKSGHIGRKIAATLASTGTPASFVHPAEASHGDLGMITAGDVIFALSNSGETPELADMLAYAKRFGIPLIGVTSKTPSALADAADVLLLLPNVPEASPVGAPTTSTAMMLALGDALAMALLEARGFTKADFATFHPGGKLGRNLLRAGDLMHAGAELPLVPERATVDDVLLTITAKRFGCAGVVDAHGRLIGAITDGDLRRHMAPDLLTKTAAQVMTRAPITVKKEMFATEALAILNEKKITSLFVVDAEKPVGVLHIHDCLRAGVV
jgi:arabinose-5-phosphate isomerase